MDIKTSEAKEAIKVALPITRLSKMYESAKANAVMVQSKQGEKHIFWVSKRTITALKGGVYMKINLPLHYKYQPNKVEKGRLVNVGSPISSTELEQNYIFSPKDVLQRAAEQEMEEAFNDELAHSKGYITESDLPIADQRHVLNTPDPKDEEEQSA